MSRHSLDETLSFIAAIDRAATPDEVSKVLLDTVKPHGFTQVLAGIIPMPGMTMQDQIANVVLHKWPEAWSERYFSQGYLFSDPTIHEVNTSTDPFIWSEIENKYRDSPFARRIMGEAREFDLGFGFTIPILTLEGQVAGFSLAAERGELQPEIRGRLQLLAMYSFARALSMSENPAPVKMTRREIDVLQWIAEGKSDWEISKILHVSEHLVDKMARHIRLKLSAANRTQAVATALRHHLIR